MKDVLGYGVKPGDLIAVIERVSNVAKYVFGTVIEIDDESGQFRMKYADGRESKWRQQCFYGSEEYNKVLLIEEE